MKFNSEMYNKLYHPEPEAPTAGGGIVTPKQKNTEQKEEPPKSTAPAEPNEPDEPNEPNEPDEQTEGGEEDGGNS